jgi:hypothetical protein
MTEAINNANNNIVSDTYLGQLVSMNNHRCAQPDKHLKLSQLHPETRFKILSNMSSQFDVNIIVSSKNALKQASAKQAVVDWFLSAGLNPTNLNVSGFDVGSNVAEQPSSCEITYEGAMNRLRNVKAKAPQNNTSQTMTIFVSLENGIMMEYLPKDKLKNPNVFSVTGDIPVNNEYIVWIDRCVCVCEIVFGTESFICSSISEGVTTPFTEVQKAISSKFEKTAGSFIATAYGWPSADWHGAIAGKNRQTIMTDCIRNALNVNVHKSNTNPVPLNAMSRTGHIKYTNTLMEFCIPETIEKLVNLESKLRLNNQEQNELDEVSFWRTVIKDIPQPVKRDKDNHFTSATDEQGIKIHNSGPVLTEDIIVTYFDGDIMYVVLVSSKEGSPTWALPGKRDRAYSPYPDISIVDANFALVEKEIEIPRSEVLINRPIMYIDDRIREERMRSNGVVSFILLKKKPKLIPGKRIGVPMNLFIDLANEKISIPEKPTGRNNVPSVDGLKLGRNHGSLIVACVDTFTFYALMEHINHMHRNFKTSGVFPEMEKFDTIYECPICSELMIDVQTICKKGHYACSKCTDKIKSTNRCPECRDPLLVIPNRIVDKIIMQRYPKEISEARNDNNKIAWSTSDLFRGRFIQYE